MSFTRTLFLTAALCLTMAGCDNPTAPTDFGEAGELELNIDDAPAGKASIVVSDHYGHTPRYVVININDVNAAADAGQFQINVAASVGNHTTNLADSVTWASYTKQGVSWVSSQGQGSGTIVVDAVSSQSMSGQFDIRLDHHTTEQNKLPPRRATGTFNVKFGCDDHPGNPDQDLLLSVVGPRVQE